MTEQVSAVQRMQDYIKENIAQHITLAELAQEAHFSPWYAHRLFRSLTGLSPAEYIRRLRLTRAAIQLKKGDCRILDIALDLGFGSVDGFIRAFQRQFGLTPGEYRLRPIPITFFVAYDVKCKVPKATSTSKSTSRKEAISMQKSNNIFIQRIQKPARRVIIKRGVAAEDYFAYCGEVGCDVWGMLLSMDSLCGEPVCLWLPKAYIAPNTSTYVQGVEVAENDTTPIPEGFDVIELPAAEYLMFQGEPFREEDYCEAIETLQDAMDRYNPAAIGCRWDNENPRIQLEPRGDRGYIELRAVKPL